MRSVDGGSHSFVDVPFAHKGDQFFNVFEAGFGGCGDQFDELVLFEVCEDLGGYSLEDVQP